MQETYTASAIRHVATARDGNIVAVGLFERTVSIWNMATGKCVSEFETVLGFGGASLALSKKESACLVSAYRRGLACYDVPSGAMRWRRRDLKQIGQVVIAPDGQHAYCCCEGAMSHILRCDGRDDRTASWRSRSVGGLDRGISVTKVKQIDRRGPLW